MTAPTLFVGVVSHRGSRFASSQGPEGLAALLGARIPGACVQVNTEDLLDESARPIDRRMVQQTLSAELHAEWAWGHYLGIADRPSWWGRLAMRWLRRATRHFDAPDPSLVRRLLNIELSHLNLMRAGLASSAAWILVLEDDAVAADPDDLATGILGILDGSSTDPRPALVNLSRSFSLAELGVEHLLAPNPDARWAGSVPRTVLTASRPVTNTVCAILYSRTFLSELVTAIDALPVEPVVPIDWRLNLALMTLHGSGRIAEGSCWLVEPAPITQMSMQPTAILPA